MTFFDPVATQPGLGSTHSGQSRSDSPTVSVVATAPETAVADMGRAMDLAGISEFLSPEIKTFLKVNISWQHWYPGCSTTPWQIEGVAKALEDLGHNDPVSYTHLTLPTTPYV